MSPFAPFSGLLLEALSTHRDILLLVLDPGGRILEANRTLTSFVDPRMTSDQPLFEQLLVSKEELAFPLTPDLNFKATTLVLAFRNGLHAQFHCTILHLADRYLLLGIRQAVDERTIMNEMAHINNELANMGRELKRKHDALVRARDEIKTLTGILPICSHCKKIKNEDGQWQQLEAYIHEHSEADFSHGLCKECVAELYPELPKNLIP